MINLNNIQNIYIDKAVKNHPKVLAILKKTNCDVEYIDSIKDVFFKNADRKKSLILSKQKGKFIKECPCTPNYLGCQYYVVELSVGCLYDCTYCYLQQYQNLFATTFYVNFEDMFKELDELLLSDPNKLFRIGFGEYADSLFLDDILNYTGEISRYLSKKHDNYLIEYKTKTNNIDNILKFEPTTHEVIGWTINAHTVINTEEKFAANFDERLEAMKKCEDRGYFVAIHFDPVVYFDGWKQGYKMVIEQLYNEIDSKKIMWTSIGSLRFNPKLKAIMEERHPDSKLIYEELIKGADNKMRYIKPLRKELYTEIVRLIRCTSKDAFIYFCMEDEEIWKDVLGLDIKQDDDIGDLFCDQVFRLTGKRFLR